MATSAGGQAAGVEARFTGMKSSSISGETTAGGLARLPALLAENDPALVLVELGANDGLRGLAVEQIRGSLERILKTCRDADAKVLLIGIELPINYGPQYRDGLRAMYRDVAHEFNAPLVPFLLAGVALASGELGLRPELFVEAMT